MFWLVNTRLSPVRGRAQGCKGINIIHSSARQHRFCRFLCAMQTRNAVAVAVCCGDGQPSISTLCVRALCAECQRSAASIVSAFRILFVLFVLATSPESGKRAKQWAKTGKVVSEEKNTRDPVPVTNAPRVGPVCECMSANDIKLLARLFDCETKQQLFIVFRSVAGASGAKSEKFCSCATRENAFCREICRTG